MIVVTGAPRPLPRILATVASLALAVGALVAVPASSAQAQWGDTGIDVPCGDTAKLISAFQTANNVLWSNSFAEVNLAPGCTYTLTQPWLGAYADRGQIDPYQGTAHGLPTLHAGIGYSRLIVNGNGATIARAAGAPRFRFLSLDELAVAQFHDLTFVNGAAPHGFDNSTTNNDYCSVFIPGDCHAAVGEGQGGGAIYNRGTLTLDHVSFTGNIAGNGENGELNHDTTGGAGGSGGAVLSYGTLTIDGGTFSGNRAGQGGNGGNDDTRAGGTGGNGGGGGAIANRGHLVLSGATFTGNRSGGPGGPGMGWFESGYSGEWGTGGAIVGVNLTIRGSLFRGNVGGEGTGGEGGAIAVDGGAATVENSTFDSNTSGAGGAVAVYHGLLAVRSATFVGNHDATDQRGADVGFADAGSTLSFTNSVMLDNGTGADCAIGGRGATSTITGSTLYTNEMRQGIDVPESDCHATSQGGFVLGALQDNGGPTLSRMPTGELLGASEECLANDQRGLPRPGTGGMCDVGAVERQTLTSAGTVTGPDHLLAGTPVVYSGVGAAGIGLQYQWSVIGVAATIDDASAASPHITFTEGGEAQVQLGVRISGVAEADGEWTYAPVLAVHVGHSPNRLPEIRFEAPNSEAAKHRGDTGHYPFTVSDPDGDAVALTGTPGCGAGATRTAWAYDPATASGSVDCRFDTAPAHNVVTVSFADEWGGARTGYYEVTVLDLDPVVTIDGPASVDAGSTATFTFVIAYSGPSGITPAPSCFGGSAAPGIALVPDSLHYTTSNFVTTGSFQCSTALGDARGQAWINGGTAGFASRTFLIDPAQIQLDIAADRGAMSENGAPAEVTYTVTAHSPNNRPMWLTSDSGCKWGTLVSGLGRTQLTGLGGARLSEGESQIVCRFGPRNGNFNLRISVYDANPNDPVVVDSYFRIADVPPVVTIVSDEGPEIDEFTRSTFHWTATDLGGQEVSVDVPYDDYPANLTYGCIQAHNNTRQDGNVTTGVFVCAFGNGPGPRSFTVNFSDGTSTVAQEVAKTLRETPPTLRLKTLTSTTLRFDTGQMSIQTLDSVDQRNGEVLTDYVINWGDGTSQAWDGGADEIFSHSYSYAGDFGITVDVTSDGVRMIGVPLGSDRQPSIPVHVTAPPLVIQAPASALEGHLIDVTVPVPAAWTGAFIVDSVGCGTNERGNPLQVYGLRQDAASFTFQCVWLYRDGATQQLSAAVRSSRGGPASLASTGIAVVNIPPRVTWTEVPDGVVPGGALYTFRFQAEDPSGYDWMSLAFAPAEATPDLPVASCGSAGVIVTYPWYDRSNGQGGIQCRFPSGGASERVLVTLVDASGARTAAPLDVPVQGDASTVHVTLTPATTAVDEGGTISFGVVVQGDGTASLFDLAVDCGPGNVLVSGPARLRGDADDRASAAVVCRFTDGPATPTVRVTAASNGHGDAASVAIAVADVAPRFADFSGVQHVSDVANTRVPVGQLIDPGADTVTNVRLDTVQSSYVAALGIWTSSPFTVNYGAGYAGIAANGILLPRLPEGETRVTLTITNEDGVFVQTRILSTSKVSLTIPGDMTVQATTPSGAVVTLPAATAIDTRTGASVPVFCDRMSGQIFQLGVATKVTCTATVEGDTSIKSYTVTVRDDTGPVVTVAPGAASVEAGAGGVGTIRYAVTAHDAVDGDVAASCDVTDGAVRGLGDWVITCTARDSRSNLGTGTATVSIRDTTPPVVSVPDDLTLEAYDGNGLGVIRPGYQYPWIGPSRDTATATDLVDGPVRANCDLFDNSAYVVQFPLGTTTVTCTATDSHGNTGSATFLVSIVDTAAPVLTVADQNAEATGPSGAAVEFTGLSAVDTVDAAPSITCDTASGSVFPLGTTTVTCTAADASGNASAPGTLTVTVVDTTAPVIDTPADLTAQGRGPGGADTVITVPATDLVDGAITASCLPRSGTMALGTVPVTCTATDAHGNTATLDLVFEVGDAAPSLTVPADIAVAAVDASGAPVTFTVTAHDEVDGELAPSCTPASGAVFPLGTTTVTCTATDSAGNVVSRSFTVTVSDQDAPVVDVPGPLTVEATGASGAVVSFAVTATDTVSGVLAPECDAASGDTFPLGVTTVTCTATDDDGNVGTAQFTVTVVDTTAPVLTVPDAVAASTTDPAGTAVAFTATSLDLVDGARAVSCTPASGAVFPIGVTTVTCSVVDAAGNRADASFTVTVGLQVVVAPHPSPATPPSAPVAVVGPASGEAPVPAPVPTPSPSASETPARPSDDEPVAEPAAEAVAAPPAWPWLGGLGALALLLLLGFLLARRRPH